MITKSKRKQINRRKKIDKARNMKKNNRVGFTNINSFLHDKAQA